MSVLSKLARPLHLLAIILGPTFAPIKNLLACVGMCVSILIIFSGLFCDFAPDPNRVRYLAATLQVREISKALERYKADCGDYPAVSSGLNALELNPGGECWKGPYLKDVPIDPWHGRYIYSRSPAAAFPEILSRGADHRPGGEFFDADISSLRAISWTRKHSPRSRGTSA